MTVPEFDQLVEYVTEGPVIHPVTLAQHSLESPFSLQALSSGYDHVESLGRLPVLSAGEVVVVKTSVVGKYHQDVIDHEIISTNPAILVDRLVWVCDHPLWRTGWSVVAGQVALYNTNLYRCVQSHTTQADWTPPATPALWTKYYAPSTVPAWIQPTGAQDAWPLGAQVTHTGHIYTSLIPANVWEPGSVGAETLWRCEDCTPLVGAWAYPVAYVIGNEVTYLGRKYRCRQAHTSIATWTPLAVPALWLDIGAA